MYIYNILNILEQRKLKKLITNNIFISQFANLEINLITKYIQHVFIKIFQNIKYYGFPAYFK